MSTTKEMSHEESLRIIKNMIQSAKNDFEDDSFQYLFWGWLVFVAAITHYVLLQMNNEYASFVWILMPIGGIVSALRSRKSNKEKKAKSYVEQFIGHISTAFLVSLCIILFSIPHLQESCYPVILVLYGIFLYVCGSVIEFNPLRIGGALNWIAAIIAFNVTFDIQLLVLASAVLVGYIIPGYLLKRKYSANNSTSAV
jgi:Flp pilus assembly protein TadB